MRPKSVKPISEEEALRRFKNFVDSFPLQGDAAKHIGVNASNLSARYHGRVRLTDSYLEHINLRRVNVITGIDENDI